MSKKLNTDRRNTEDTRRIERMLKDIIAVKSINDYWVYLRFGDGVEGKVNIAELIEFRGVFAQLSKPAYFAQVCVNPELGTII